MSIFDIRPERWTEHAACVGEDPEIFFPIERAGRRFRDESIAVRGAEAKAICAGCDVRDRCLTEALEQESTDAMRWGIRGGLNEAERGRLARKNGAA